MYLRGLPPPFFGINGKALGPMQNEKHSAGLPPPVFSVLDQGAQSKAWGWAWVAMSCRRPSFGNSRQTHAHNGKESLWPPRFGIKEKAVCGNQTPWRSGRK